MKKLYGCLFIVLAISGCSTMTPSEKETKRDELDTMAQAAITGLLKQDETIQAKLDNSLGYAVANMKVTKVPIVGAGGGEGVFLDKETGRRIYFTVSRFDIGGGWGVRSYKVLLVAETQQIVDRFNEGAWEFQAGVEASAGTASAEGTSGGSNEGFSLHLLSDGGASATATARVIRIKVNDELTDNP